MALRQEAPVSKVNTDDIFNLQLKALQAVSADNARAVMENLQPRWMMPQYTAPEEASSGQPSWNADLFDLENLGQPFSRQALNEAFVEILKDVTNAGTTGDLITATTQIDYLGCLERAFRARHTMRRPRAMAHAAGRMYGHGHDRGPLVQTGLEYIRDLEKAAKGPQAP